MTSIQIRSGRLGVRAEPAVASARALLDRLLDRPSPLALVQSLSVDTVVRLIERVGLEDLGDVLALLSPEQLTHVLDQDLWRSLAPGLDARFDAQRFSLWLAVLVEQSPELAARKLSELDFELVALGFSQQLLVVDMEQLAETVLQGDHSEDEEQLDKALESGLYHELEQYRVIARDTRSFDALLAILVELNTQDYDFLWALLERCCTISGDYVDSHGGLYEVLSAAETIEADVAGEREERREQRGFVAASSALAFLKLARQTPLTELLTADATDPLTRAHFRTSEPAKVSARAGAGDPSDRPLTSMQGMAGGLDTAEARLMAAIETLVAEQPATRRSLPRSTRKLSLLARALGELAVARPADYERCVLEASYLANVLWAGVGTSERGLEPNEAAEIGFSVCELGADELVNALAVAQAGRVQAVTERLSHAGLVKLFQIGFQRMCARELPSGLLKKPAVGASPSPLSRLRRLLEAQGLVLSTERNEARAPARASKRGVARVGPARVPRSRPAQP